MDSRSPSFSKEESKEVARETLIAISNALPEKTPDLDCASEAKKVDGVAALNTDGDDKYRTELISISYVDSPDIKI